jgi:hypothetical protein
MIMMHEKNRTVRCRLAGLVIGCATIAINGAVITAVAQEPLPEKPVATKLVNNGGRDPFRKYEIARTAIKKISGQVVPPSIQERIYQYKTQKQAAMNARLPAPKPTTALLLSEVQVIGITRTPRGYAAIVEATPIKLSYVIYPGETFYDGQLVAIEDSRLVFRHETVFIDGRRERAVELKNLRVATVGDSMAATQPAVTSDKP